METAIVLPETPILESRELWWNIDTEAGKVIFYLLATISMAIFAYGVYQKYKKIFSGKKFSREDRFGEIKTRLLSLLGFGLLQKKIRQKKIPGIAHLLTALGFVILWIVTDIVAIQEHFFKSIKFFQGTFYKIVSFSADIGGLLLFVGIIIFILRRYLFKSKHLDNTQLDWIQPVFLLLLVVSGFLIEAFRMVATKQFEDYAPVGKVLAHFFSYMTEADLKKTHALLWWSHSILTFSFIALIPYTKFMHMFTSPLSIFFKSKRARGQLYTPYSLVDMMNAEAEGKEINEEDFTAGVFKYDDFSWKTLLDSEACTACGRCHVSCPAQNTEKPLSPKFLMLDIKSLSLKSPEEKDNLY